MKDCKGVLTPMCSGKMPQAADDCKGSGKYIQTACHLLCCQQNVIVYA